VQDKAGKYGRILGKFKIHDGKEDRQTTINEWMIENHYAVAYHGQSKEAVADEHLKNYKEIVEGVDITQNELDMYINSRS
jgi:endonuclease YncB( thermonuclease family)